MTASMERIVADDYDQLSHIGADLIAEFMSERPNANLVVATGNTPMGIYRDLAERRRAGMLDTSGISVFQLDEYVGLAPDDRRSLFGWTMRSFVTPLRIPPENVHRILDGRIEPEAACGAYDDLIDGAGGIDLAILGLGPNGHLGFNEPPAGPDLPTRAVDLTPESVESNGVYWGGPAQVPLRAVTLGMAQLLAARRILLVVSGAHKQGILARTMTAPPTPQVPASFLQDAPNVTVLADRAAWGQIIVNTPAAS
jgi:glucosamine-6-phosphate deaminase